MSNSRCRCSIAASRLPAGMPSICPAEGQHRNDFRGMCWTSPGFPETFLSGIGALGLEGSRFWVMLLGLPGSLVLVGREPVESGLDTAAVVPSVDVAEQR